MILEHKEARDMITMYSLGDEGVDRIVSQGR